MTTIIIIVILLIIAFLLWLILANHKPANNKPDNTIIATYTQNGTIHNGSLRKGCQRPNN
jgi:YbbR domain-containing protein